MSTPTISRLKEVKTKKEEEYKEEKMSRTMTEGWPQMAWYSYVALCYMLHASKRGPVLHCVSSEEHVGFAVAFFPKMMLNVYSSVHKLLISNEPNHSKTN